MIILLSLLAEANETSESPKEAVIEQSDEVSSEESVTDVQHLLLYSGTDPEPALIRTAAASKLTVEAFLLQTMVDLGGQSSPAYWSQIGDGWFPKDLEVCNGKSVTNKHIQSTRP